MASVVGYHDLSIDQVLSDVPWNLLKLGNHFWPIVMKSYVVAEENYIHLQRECDSCIFLFICNSVLKSGLYDLNILCDSGVRQLNLCCVVNFLTIVCVQMIFIGW